MTFFCKLHQELDGPAKICTDGMETQPKNQRSWMFLKPCKSWEKLPITQLVIFRRSGCHQQYLDVS